MEWFALEITLAAELVLTGCGTPGAPAPPSLNLPDRVTNLTAARAGDVVSLAWTMPKKNTDKLLLKGDMQVRVCRMEGEGACNSAGNELQLAPGSEGAFTETLPQALAVGAPRVLSYFVELNNHVGRSAGRSNVAAILTGEAPGPVDGLAANVRKEGIVLDWNSSAARPGQSLTAIRLHRRLLTPTASKPIQGEFAPKPEPLEQTLLVEVDAHAGRVSDRTLDKDVRLGGIYEYRAQHVARVTVNGQTLELAGPISPPVRVETKDVFPPAVPAGLAAVATTESGAEASIDLSWQPDAEADLAGYVVYRREGEEAWKRVSPMLPLAAPTFHDAQIESGHTYYYAVSAIDQSGHESARSAEAQETVPNQ